MDVNLTANEIAQNYFKLYFVTRSDLDGRESSKYLALWEVWQKTATKLRTWREQSDHKKRD